MFMACPPTFCGHSCLRPLSRTSDDDTDLNRVLQTWMRSVSLHLPTVTPLPSRDGSAGNGAAGSRDRGINTSSSGGVVRGRRVMVVGGENRGVGAFLSYSF